MDHFPHLFCLVYRRIRGLFSKVKFLDMIYLSPPLKFNTNLIISIAIAFVLSVSKVNFRWEKYKLLQFIEPNFFCVDENNLFERNTNFSQWVVKSELFITWFHSFNLIHYIHFITWWNGAIILLGRILQLIFLDSLLFFSAQFFGISFPKSRWNDAKKQRRRQRNQWKNQLPCFSGAPWRYSLSGTFMNGRSWLQPLSNHYHRDHHHYIPSSHSCVPSSLLMPLAYAKWRGTIHHQAK